MTISILYVYEVINFPRKQKTRRSTEFSPLLKQLSNTQFFIRMPYFSLGLNILKTLNFEPRVILKLFLTVSDFEH